MKQIIKIQNSPDGQQRVFARDLYTRLGYADRQFARWAKKHIIANPYAVEGADWVRFDTCVEGNYVPDYMLSVDFAKKVCMISKTVVGEKIRNYFVEVEKAAFKAVAPQIGSGARLNELEAKISRFEALIEATSDVSAFSVFGYASLCGKKLYGSEATTIGKRASRRCRELGLPIGKARDPRFGTVNTYPESVLHEIFSDHLSKPRF